MSNSSSHFHQRIKEIAALAAASTQRVIIHEDAEEECEAATARAEEEYLKTTNKADTDYNKLFTASNITTQSIEAFAKGIFTNENTLQAFLANPKAKNATEFLLAQEATGHDTKAYLKLLTYLTKRSPTDSDVEIDGADISSCTYDYLSQDTPALVRQAFVKHTHMLLDLAARNLLDDKTSQANPLSLHFRNLARGLTNVLALSQLHSSLRAKAATVDACMRLGTNAREEEITEAPYSFIIAHIAKAQGVLPADYVKLLDKTTQSLLTNIAGHLTPQKPDIVARLGVAKYQDFINGIHHHCFFMRNKDFPNSVREEIGVPFVLQAAEGAKLIQGLQSRNDEWTRYHRNRVRRITAKHPQAAADAHRCGYISDEFFSTEVASSGVFGRFTRLKARFAGIDLACLNRQRGPQLH